MAVLCFKGPAVQWLVLQDLSLGMVFFKSPLPFPSCRLVVMGEEKHCLGGGKAPECVT